MMNTTTKKSTAGANSRNAPSVRLSPNAKRPRQPDAWRTGRTSATAIAASEIDADGLPESASLRPEKASRSGSRDHRDHRKTRTGTPTGRLRGSTKLRYLVSSKGYAIPPVWGCKETPGLFKELCPTRHPAL